MRERAGPVCLGLGDPPSALAHGARWPVDGHGSRHFAGASAVVAGTGTGVFHERKEEPTEVLENSQADEHQNDAQDYQRG